MGRHCMNMDIQSKIKSLNLALSAAVGARGFSFKGGA